MVARQAPTDVHAWLQNHAASQAAGGVWLSLDYSDFNKEHRWWELAAINLDFATAWLTHPQTDIRASKHRAALWTAYSHNNRWAVQGSTTWQPLHGLFSGHRDTGRDNTLLHQIYQEMQLTVAGEYCDGFRNPIVSYKCGDDEDTWFPTEADAMIYYGVGAALGWHFNPRKQMLGPSHHEFLQYMCAGDGAPSQPLIPSLVAFVSGNWYKDPLADIAGMAEAIVRVGIELISRGASAQPTLDMTHMVASLWYKWSYGHYVRWDALLSEQLRHHPALLPLRPPGYPRKQIPCDSRLMGTIRALNPPGVQTALSRWWPLLEQIPPGQRQSAIDTIKLDAFRSWFVAAWNRCPPKPVIPAGWVPALMAANAHNANLAQVLAVGDHALNPDQPLTLQKLAGITGVPAAILSCLDLAALSRTATPLLAGYMGFLDATPPPLHLAKLRAGLLGSITWMK
jgi:hypothetical protein